MLTKIKQIDWLIILLLGIFTIAGTALVYSATIDDPKIHVGIAKSLLNYGMGFFAFFVVALTDYRVLIKTSPYTYAISILLLVAVYFFGVEKNGAKSWFVLPAIGNFQPAELMKVVLIIAIAAYLARRQGEKLLFFRDVLPIGLIVLLPFMLVLMQPDLGNAIIFLVILLGMYWIGNIKYMHVLIGTALVAGLLYGSLFMFKHYHEPIQTYLDAHHKGHWVARIDTFLDPAQASEDEKYQVNNSMIAIGSGGLSGDSYLHGNSVHKGFIPYAYSDSIFVVVGEEFGFLGGAGLLLIYFLLIYRMILIAIQSYDVNGSYLIVGVVSLFIFQIFENIGMLIGIMPLTGITLPFVSYGGTSLLINMVSVGIVTSVRLHQEKPSMFGEPVR